MVKLLQKNLYIADTFMANICYGEYFFWTPREHFGQDFPLNSGNTMINLEKKNTWMFLFDTFLYFNMRLIINMKLFFTHFITLASPLKIFYSYFKYQFYTTIDFTWMWPLHECDDLQTEEIWKPLCSSLAD